MDAEKIRTLYKYMKANNFDFYENLLIKLKRTLTKKARADNGEQQLEPLTEDDERILRFMDQLE